MIFRSPFPEIVVPDVPLHDLLLRRTDELGDKPALIDAPTGRTITYGQLKLGAHLLAASLARRGFQKGDVFAIYCPNLPEYAAAILAVSLAGGAVTTVNPLYTADELASQLNDTGAVYLLTIPQFLEKARDAAARSRVREVFVLGEAQGATAFASLLASDGRPPEVAFDVANDVVALPYSSGTTGFPKGVMLTHRSIGANVVQAASALSGLNEHGTVMGVLPFFHIYGITIILGVSLYMGATIVTMPRFELDPFLQALQDYAVTYAPLVPPIIVALAKHPAVEKYDLSKLATIGSGAAPLGKEVEEACQARIGCLVGQGYGMTETSCTSHVSPLEGVRSGSAGVPLPNTECKVVDLATGGELGPREEGEVCLRGPQIMKGYLNHPEATAAMLDPEGWLHTGDIGFCDEDGYLYVVDRVKELIKYKGLQVAPAELEAVLLTHPAVADAAVIPSPDEEAGEVPKAFVVLKSRATAEELQAYVAGRVAPHKKIRRLEFVDAIPKALSGKILRRVLVEQERARVGSAMQS